MSAQTVGALLVERKKLLNRKDIEEFRSGYCGSPVARLWQGKAVCDQVTAQTCNNGCEIRALRPACAGVLVDHYFVTAGHCLHMQDKNLGQQAELRVVTNDGTLVEAKLTETPVTRHVAPYDLAIYRVQPRAALPAPARISITAPSLGEPVYAIGLPYISEKLRPVLSGAYTRAYGERRISFGRVTEANLTHRSYCAFSNENELAHPETWKLENTCPKRRPTEVKYAVREERDPLLTDTDMTYGMSGSGLFNQAGELIGIGSTALSSNPGAYSSRTPALYVEIAAVRELIAKIR